ncbi:HlyD family efflux transporter periplasmic adaptor subunit [Geminocystis sp. NIES-3709]|uniref:HlyD family efflux transporter periplasmic adaptor subunit n=1 Tax=Geminocystis sp. NIES-3709 TaxID=1617448 RepID=UPI0005FCD2F9|nr:HlyD family efflux transporter periplasmic adaptor subunit [Geminocystis sp. NIES-3709]BAQ64713.1 heterocyst specific ABC-transporter [Geminocystis sp. NIES-3709]
MGESTSFLGKNGKQITIFTSILGAVIVTATGIYIFQQSGVKTTPPPVTTQITQKSVTALGRIEPLGEIIKVAASPTMSGAKVKTLLVTQGDIVKQGDIIAITTDFETKKAELETAKQEVKVVQANLAIVQAGAKEGTIKSQESTIERLKAELNGVIATDKAKISRLKAQLSAEMTEKKANIQRLKAEVNNAQSELQRYQELAKDGVISESNLDSKQLTFDTTTQSYQEAKASYEKTITTVTEEIREAKALATQRVNTLTKEIAEGEAKLGEIREIRSVDVVQAQSQVDKAIALVKQAEIELDLTTIKAPTDGTIIEILAREGENIDNGIGVVEMANTDQMLAIAEVYESDVSKIKLGQETTIKSDNNSFKETLKGKVIEISPKIGKKDVLETDPAASVDARVVEVKIAINPEDNPIVNQLIYAQIIAEILL